MNAPGNRQRGRQLALQALYEADLAFHNAGQALEALLEGEHVPPGPAEAARSILRGVMDQRIEVDSLIEKAAPLWPLAQVAAIDRNVLRLAAYELVLDHGQKPPDAVIINEAVELAKRFGTESSARFVNGVLGTLIRGARPQGSHVATP